MVIKKGQLFKQEGGVGAVRGTHQHVYFTQIKIYAHKQSGEESGAAGARSEHVTTVRTLDGKSGKCTPTAAVLAPIGVQHDRLVFINTFQEGASSPPK